MNKETAIEELNDTETESLQWTLEKTAVLKFVFSLLFYSGMSLVIALAVFIYFTPHFDFWVLSTASMCLGLLHAIDKHLLNDK